MKQADLSVRRQCGLLSLARSSLYYQPRGESPENLAFMKIINRQFLETPPGNAIVWLAADGEPFHIYYASRRHNHPGLRALTNIIRRHNGLSSI